MQIDCTLNHGTDVMGVVFPCRSPFVVLACFTIAHQIRLMCTGARLGCQKHARREKDSELTAFARCLHLFFTFMLQGGFRCILENMGVSQTVQRKL